MKLYVFKKAVLGIDIVSGKYITNRMFDSDVNINSNTNQFATTKKRHPHSFDYSEKTVQWISKRLTFLKMREKTLPDKAFKC